MHDDMASVIALSSIIPRLLTTYAAVTILRDVANAHGHKSHPLLRSSIFRPIYPFNSLLPPSYIKMQCYCLTILIWTPASLQIKCPYLYLKHQSPSSYPYLLTT